MRDAMALAVAACGSAAVSVKSGRDVVTSADVDAEDLLRSRLPGVVVGEERGGARPDDGSPFWLVDPICGTRNYASGVPLWCVNVALVSGGVVVGSVIGDPSTGDVLVAESGLGAWVGDARVATSASSGVVVVEDGKTRGARRAEAAAYCSAFLLDDRYELRVLSSTLSSAYVATGRVAGYVLFGISAEHGAAGAFAVLEAGGVVTEVDGSPWHLDSPTLLAAADPAVHQHLRDLL